MAISFSDSFGPRRQIRVPRNVIMFLRKERASPTVTESRVRAPNCLSMENIHGYAKTRKKLPVTFNMVNS